MIRLHFELKYYNAAVTNETNYVNFIDTKKKNWSVVDFAFE